MSFNINGSTLERFSCNTWCLKREEYFRYIFIKIRAKAKAKYLDMFHYKTYIFLSIVPQLQTLITQPPSQSNNLCYFKGFGEVADPLSCDHYYACTNTRSIRVKCPAGLYFKSSSSNRGVCDYPSNVKCSVRPTK